MIFPQFDPVFTATSVHIKYYASLINLIPKLDLWYTREKTSAACMNVGLKGFYILKKNLFTFFPRVR